MFGIKEPGKYPIPSISDKIASKDPWIRLPHSLILRKDSPVKETSGATAISFW